jgi:biotin operon repressor
MLIDLTKHEINTVMKSLLYSGLHIESNKHVYRKLYNALILEKDEDHK